MQPVTVILKKGKCKYTYRYIPDECRIEKDNLSVSRIINHEAIRIIGTAFQDLLNEIPLPEAKK